jgi:uncharacterized protein YyaL (SSP411 family)
VSNNNSSKPNALINASSPYLKQHANNPVQWHEWGSEALQKARAENKPLLISIGYSACHWCHVMAHEVFEDESSAALMNEYFINIKIDREERPDIDQIYMDAIQLLTGKGGWPLNVFTLPDGRPFYGGTYFRKQDWDSVLKQLNELWQNKPETVFEYATYLSKGIEMNNSSEAIRSQWIENDFHYAIQQIKSSIDKEFGGFNRAPKFPLPVVYEFVLHYVHLFPEPEMQRWLLLSLKKMSLGGLYDTVGGGYSRYSVDARWHAPHFEKMLYDNAQLLSLLAKTFMVTGDVFLQEKIEETYNFIMHEWQSPEGGLYSALDADSEGEEGKYYCYTIEDLKKVGLPLESIMQYYHLSEQGNWEHGKNILYAAQTPADFIQSFGLDKSSFETERLQFLSDLAKARETRVKPGLDDKILTGWNALAATGLLNCYGATGYSKYLNTARLILNFLDKEMFKEGKLYRNYKNGESGIPAFLEDYVFYAEALTLAYQLTLEEDYLLKARDLIDIVLSEFKQKDSPFLVFNPDPQGELFVKKTDLGDDIIPSANSVFCELLIKHSFYFDERDWYELAGEMLETIRDKSLQGPAWFCRWLSAALLYKNGVNQLTFVGENLKSLLGNYLPNTIVSVPSEKLPAVSGKLGQKPGYYLCRDFECFAPETDFDKVWQRLF